jgi:predicted TIM-barrel fold metal-dependent hydrolase
MPTPKRAFGTIRRRTLLAAAAAPATLDDARAGAVEPAGRLRKIATEEAFMIPEIAAALGDVVRRGGASLDLALLSLVYGAQPASAPGAPGDRDAAARRLLPQLLDVDGPRLADMDASGVDMAVLSLGLPGVQVFEPAQAVSLARLANDRLSDIVRRHPARFAGLATFAPHDPSAATREMERAIGSLRLNGFLVNSHTNGVYLDHSSAWPMLEAAEALDAPIYIHPRAPSDGMAAPFRDYRMEGAIWGYGVETATHAVRLMLSGTLDRFPRLRIILGHMGEALPFWMWRLDYMASPGSRAALRNQLKPSEYLQRNFVITTAGIEDPAVLRFCIDKLGAERIMWAVDYPYQRMAPAAAFIEEAPLSNTERSLIAHANAERIFRIGRQPRSQMNRRARRH